MKIIDNRKGNLQFKDLKPGDVFVDADGDIIMKTCNNGCLNAVGLNSCHIYDLPYDHEVVELLNATLTIEG